MNPSHPGVRCGRVLHLPFMMRVVKHWLRLLREGMKAPPLETFKVGLDRALSKLV